MAELFDEAHSVPPRSWRRVVEDVGVGTRPHLRYDRWGSRVWL